jgi:sRNA-binding protein
VPEARKPEPTRPPEAKPTPKEEAKPAAKALARDVVVLTGSPLGGVRFEHKLHAARAASNCAACHHASRKEKPATAPQQACSDCHAKAAAPPMKTRYQAAFHNPTAQSGICIDCHKAESAKAKKAPLKCVECHKKENK